MVEVIVFVSTIDIEKQQNNRPTRQSGGRLSAAADFVFSRTTMDANSGLFHRGLRSVHEHLDANIVAGYFGE